MVQAVLECAAVSIFRWVWIAKSLGVDPSAVAEVAGPSAADEDWWLGTAGEGCDAGGHDGGCHDEWVEWVGEVVGEEEARA